MLATARGRAWRVGADIRRRVTRTGSATSALASLGRPDRRNAGEWNAATTAGHDRYRAAHPVPDERVAIVCVSMRPEYLDAVVANIQRQSHSRVEVVFVANSDEFDIAVVERAFAPMSHVAVDHPPSGTSLGGALNRAMERTDARFVAKFDDDDLYGANFIPDALRAHSYAGAGVVGKHSYYAHLVERDQLVVRFPGHEFSYSGTLAGGTLVIDRDRVGDQRFDDVSIGEDRAFLARCHRRGISTYSADRFNFTQVRHASNTWNVSTESFLARTSPVPDDTVVDR